MQHTALLTMTLELFRIGSMTIYIGMAWIGIYELKMTVLSATLLKF